MLSEDYLALASFSGVARLFPLPNLVLFPHVDQGLHIFEPRYRQMTADALDSDGLIAMALLCPGSGDPEPDAQPRIAEIACLGRIVGHEQLPDGRYNLRLRGLSRLRLLEEVPSEGKLYRLARSQVIGDISPAEPSRAIQLRKELKQAVVRRFEPSGVAFHQLDDLFDSDSTLGQLCDLLSYALPFPLALKLQLLAEPDVVQRVEGLLDFLRIPAIARKFPPDFSPN